MAWFDFLTNKNSEESKRRREAYEKQQAAKTEEANRNKAHINTFAPQSGLNMWEQKPALTFRGGDPVTGYGGATTDPTAMSSYFSNPVPVGLQGFDAGVQAGKNVVSQVYGSQDAKDIWNQLKDQSQQGLDATALKSIKDRYGSQGVTEQAKIQKAGLKGTAALRAGEDLASQRRQEAAAMDQAIKKQSFESLRDEWGRRTLLSTNLPVAYGQLGSAASLGQVIQNLAGSKINY